MQGTRRTTRLSIKKEQNGLGITSCDAATQASTEALPNSSALSKTRTSATKLKTYAGVVAPSQIDSRITVDVNDIRDSHHHRNLRVALNANTSTLPTNPVADTSAVNSFYNSLRLHISKIFVNNRWPIEFGLCFGVIALLLLSHLVVWFLHLGCLINHTDEQYASMEFNFMSFVADIFYAPAIAAYLTFIVAIFSLSIVLPGRYVRIANGGATYKFTALPIAIVFLILFTIAEYYGYAIAEFIIQHYGRFGIYGVLISYVVATWLHLRSNHIVHDKDGTRINEYGKTGNIIIDYALGRQINPKLLGLIEFKEIFYRISLISPLMYTISLIYETIHVSLVLNARYNHNMDILHYIIEQTKYDQISLLSNCMLFFYIMDAIVFEHHLTFSFELQGEGLGCLLLLRYALTPYLLSAISTYFFSNRIAVKSTFVIYIAVALFSIGLLLKRGSNSLKYKYRFNPNRKIFHNVRTIHTSKGRRLLLHSMWGVVRQPNYLGDILALLAMSVLLMQHFHFAPCMSINLLIIQLIHRCQRVNARNLARYHTSWLQYCHKVPYYLIPYVY